VLISQHSEVLQNICWQIWIPHKILLTIPCKPSLDTLSNVSLTPYFNNGGLVMSAVTFIAMKASVLTIQCGLMFHLGLVPHSNVNAVPN
jgi:hypothetical protein